MRLDPDKHYKTMPHILVVDDDDRIRDLVTRYLNEHEHVAIGAANAAQARDMMKVGQFDAMVLDVMMPGQDGVSFVREMRDYSNMPVLLLTALGEVDDRLSGFAAGADDYLSKPFDPRELIVRLASIMRRREGQNTKNNADKRIGPYRFLLDLKELKSEDKVIKLTDVEARLLDALLQKPGEVMSRTALAKLCDLESGGERTIDVQVTRLRRKIEEDTQNPRLLITVRGKGYVLKTE